MKYKSSSAIETQAIAAKIAKQFKSGGVIALLGELGAGKTTFTQGFAKALGIRDKIISPTFILIRQHPLPNSKMVLYHVDLYRLESVNPKDIGLEEIISNPQNIILIEWAEKIANKLPINSTKILFRKISENQREIEVI